MTALLTEARRALEAQRASEDAARDTWRRDQSTAALAELRTVLTLPDGTAMKLADYGVSRVESDMDAGVAVWSDGTVSIACRRDDQRWECRLVQRVDGGWTPVSGRLRSLADLGAALEGARPAEAGPQTVAG